MIKPGVQLGKLILKNPLILASGTFDRSIAKKIDINRLGGLVTKTVTLKPQPGNPLPHIIKTKYGWLNSVGLKNPGIKKYLSEELPFWQKFQTQVIPSIGGENQSEYLKLATILNHQKNIPAIEINVSCPNLDRSGMQFGTDIKLLKKLILSIHRQFNREIIVKLAPNVNDIVKLAKVSLEAGADIISLTNTFLAMEIDNSKRKAKLFRKIGGYSGGAIKPIALRMVWQVYQKLKCPIIGGGGIEDFNDFLDYIMVGATAVSIGSANFLEPQISTKILNSYHKYLKENKIKDINKIRGII